MSRAKWAGLACSLAAMPSIADACTLPPPTVRLPAESEALFEARSKATLEAIKDEDRRSFQVSLREKSLGSFIGIVERRDQVTIEDGVGSMVSVRPIKKLTGTLPSGPFVLRDKRLTTCGTVGGGTATSGLVGEYVIVFREMPFASGREDFGIRAQEARDPFLLQALTEFAQEARDDAGPGPAS
jgi:hypothetical protein